MQPVWLWPVSAAFFGKSVAKHLKPWQLPPHPGETESALQLRQDLAYFAEQLDETADWWNRMGESLDVSNAQVLDFGCGHGALSLSAAKRGAAAVLGIDLDVRRIQFARNHVPSRYPDLARKVNFEAADIAEVNGKERFDVVLSKDTFEHVEDLPAAIREMHRLLRPGGRLFVGFGPLFHSPFGDHGRLAPGLPWLPALLPERVVLGMASRRHGAQLSSMADVGLNKLTPAQFRGSFPKGAWRVDRILYNQSGRRLMPVLNVLRRLPWLERWFTVGIYAVVSRV